MGNIGVSMPSGHMDACQYRDFGCFCHNREFLRICAIVRATYEHVAIGDFVLFTIVKSILELMPVYGVFFLFSTIIGSILGSMPLFKSIPDIGSVFVFRHYWEYFGSISHYRVIFCHYQSTWWFICFVPFDGKGVSWNANIFHGGGVYALKAECLSWEANIP